MHSRALLIASVVVIHASVASLASAQSSTEPGSASAAPAAPMPATDTNPVQTGVTTPTTEVAPAPMPAPTIPLAQDEHRDIVEHSWPNRPLLVTGLVVFGGTYVASAIVGAASNREADEKLLLPVVGPWLDLKHRDCDVNACGNDGFNKALLISDGALQGLGALAMVMSLIIPESTKKPWYLIGDEKLMIGPRLGSTTGLSASGAF